MHSLPFLTILILSCFGLAIPQGAGQGRPGSAPAVAQEGAATQATTHQDKTPKAELGRQDDELDRIAEEVIAQVSELSGLAFRGQVRARYANKKVFLQYMLDMEIRLMGPDRRAKDQAVARLLGLIPMDMDLAAVQEEILASQVGGFYDPSTKTFFIMEGLSPDLMRLIMAHELAHALDDQYYSLFETDQRLAAQTDRVYAHHAVAEGSAQVIMQMWLAEHLKDLDRQALIDFQKQMDFDVLSKSPRLVWQPLVALYNQGQAFLGKKAKLGMGVQVPLENIRLAFTDLPRSTEQILHPEKYWEEGKIDEPQQLAHSQAGGPEASLSHGFQVIHTDVLGELTLAMMTQPQTKKVTLFSLAGMRFTHDEARGWDGDRVTLCQSPSGQVLVWDVVWDGAPDAKEFLQATVKWSRGPAGPSANWSEIGPDHLRYVAWTGVSREVAGEVASELEVSRLVSDRIPARPELPASAPQGREPGGK